MSHVAPLSGVKPKVVNGAHSVASSVTTAKSDGQQDVETETDDPSARRAHDRRLAGQHGRDEAVDVSVHPPMDGTHPWSVGSGSPLGEVEAGAEVVAGCPRDG